MIRRSGARTSSHWGRLPIAPEAKRTAPDRDQIEEAIASIAPRLLPRGAGRTYGDTCANSGGTLVSSERFDRILEFDSDTGRVVVESGVTLGKLLAHTLPSGWIVPACPGTAHVTVGGMVGHDVHGKDHVHAGTIGRFVRSLDLVRSNGRVRCGPGAHRDLFRATIGGLGLTGFIERVELQLVPCPLTEVETERIRCTGLASALALLGASDDHDYTLLWVDSFSLRGRTERCVVLRARHVPGSPERRRRRSARASKAVGALTRIVPPVALGRTTMRIVNRLYHRGSKVSPSVRTVRREHVTTFLFPQDVAHPSGRIYGRKGVLGHHSLVPNESALHALLERLARPGDEPIVLVLKAFGDHPSPGMLSFTGRGISVALGFKNSGESIRSLLRDLDAIVLDAGGKLYPAKDARMDAATFARSYPEASDFARYVDPAFGSNFWSRTRPRPT